MLEQYALLQDALSLLLKGGPVMMILLALSVLALAIIFVKLLQFSRARLKQIGFVDSAIAILARGERERAISTLRREVKPVARVMETAIAVNNNANLPADARDAEDHRSRPRRAHRRDSAIWKAICAGSRSSRRSAPCWGCSAQFSA